MKNIRIFYPKIFLFLVVKFSIYLNRRFRNGSPFGVERGSGCNFFFFFFFFFFLVCVLCYLSLFACSSCVMWLSIRKHAYSNILKILPPTYENFQIKKKSDIFHVSVQNIDCGYSLEPPRRGGSNEYPQFMFWAEIRKIIYTPVNPSFTI